MSVRACIDRVIPTELRQEAMRAAAQENPANVQTSPLELVVEHKKLWQPGRTLRVRFLEGSPKVKSNVQRFAEQWMQYANIKLQFVDSGDAEIRVAFKDDGSWSAVGTDALVTQAFKKDEATMNYGWLTESSTDDDYSGVVLHEFGHALGMIHEHQNPSAKIQWNREAVYAYYARDPNRWSRADVDHNLFETYDPTRTQFTACDPRSIMMYPIPPEHLEAGDPVGWNTELSDDDKAFVASLYPFPP